MNTLELFSQKDNKKYIAESEYCYRLPYRNKLPRMKENKERIIKVHMFGEHISESLYIAANREGFMRRLIKDSKVNRKFKHLIEEHKK